MGADLSEDGSADGLGEGSGLADSELKVVVDRTVGSDGGSGLDGKEDSVTIEGVESVGGSGSNGGGRITGSTNSVGNGVFDVSGNTVDGDGTVNRTVEGWSGRVGVGNNNNREVVLGVLVDKVEVEDSPVAGGGDGWSSNSNNLTIVQVLVVKSAAIFAVELAEEVLGGDGIKNGSVGWRGNRGNPVWEGRKLEDELRSRVNNKGGFGDASINIALLVSKEEWLSINSGIKVIPR